MAEKITSQHPGHGKHETLENAIPVYLARLKDAAARETEAAITNQHRQICTRENHEAKKANLILQDVPCTAIFLGLSTLLHARVASSTGPTTLSGPQSLSFLHAPHICSGRGVRDMSCRRCISRSILYPCKQPRDCSGLVGVLLDECVPPAVSMARMQALHEASSVASLVSEIVKMDNIVLKPRQSGFH